MNRNVNEVDVLLQAVCVYGLRMKVEDLPKRERARQIEALQGLLDDGYTAGDLWDALRYGMPETWPFLDGRPYDAADLRANTLKAVAQAKKARQERRTFHRPDGSRA